MWLFLWVIFVLCAIGFFLWSYYTTFEQKNAWKAYAQKNKLTYYGGRFLDSPEMTGDIKGRQVNFYPQIVEGPDGRKSTQNVIEVFLNTIPDATFVVSSKGFLDFIVSTGLTETFMVDAKNWPKNILCFRDENENPETWFQNNQKSIEAVNQMVKLPFDAALIADGNQAFIAIRTSNPLSEPVRLNQVVRKIFSLVEMLEQTLATTQSKMANPKDDSEMVDPDTSAPDE